MWVRVVGLVYLCTQPILFQKHLQYKLITTVVIPSDAVKLPMGDNAFTFIEDHVFML